MLSNKITRAPIHRLHRLPVRLESKLRNLRLNYILHGNDARQVHRSTVDVHQLSQAAQRQRASLSRRS